MAELTYREAVTAGMAQEMRLDPNVVFLGEDVAAAGGVFKTTVVSWVSSFTTSQEILGTNRPVF